MSLLRISKSLIERGSSRVTRMATATKIRPTQSKMRMSPRRQLMINVSSERCTLETVRKNERTSRMFQQIQSTTRFPIRVIHSVLLFVATTIEL